MRTVSSHPYVSLPVQAGDAAEQDSGCELHPPIKTKRRLFIYILKYSVLPQ